MDVTQDQVRALACALPEVEEGSHRGRPDLRVGGKIFATLPEDGQSVNIKIAPENFKALVDRNPDIYSKVWGERWIGVSLRSVAASDVGLLLEDGWRLTAPKKLVKNFDAT